MPMRPDTAQPSFADSSHRRRRKRTADERPDALDGHEHSDKTRTPVQFVTGESPKEIAVSINPTTLSATASEIAMRRRIGVRATWWKTGGDFSEKMLWRTLRLFFAHVAARGLRIPRSRTCRVQRSDPVSADDDEETGTNEWRDEAKTFTHRSQEAVGVPSCSVGNNTVKECRLSGSR